MKLPVLLALSLIPTLATAQTIAVRRGGNAALTTPTEVCRPCPLGTPVDSLPGGGNARHMIVNDGRYDLRANLDVGAGEIGILIAPTASHVSIYLNGYSIRGGGGGGAVAVHGDLTVNGDLRVEGGSISGFGGGIHASFGSVVTIRRVDFSDCNGGAVVVTQCETFRMDECSVRGGNIGLLLTDVGNARVRSSTFDGCGTGVQACAQSTTLTDCNVTGSTGDGVVVTDACSPPGAYRFSLTVTGLDAYGNGLNALRVVSSGAEQVTARLKVSNLGSSGCDGVSIDLGGGGDGELDIESCTISGSVQDAVRLTNTGSGTLSGRLKVSNLGSSGCDGVSIDVGGGGNGDLEIEACTISGSVRNGVFLTNTGTGNVSCKLKVSNLGSSGCDGVSIDSGGGGSTDLEAEACTFAGNARYGVGVVGTGSGQVSTRLKVSNLGSSGCDGVSISVGDSSDGDFEISECTFARNVVNGLSVNSTSSGSVRGVLKVSNLGSSGCDGVSIDLGGSGSGSFEVSECLFEGNVTNGLILRSNPLLSHAALRIHDSSFSGNGNTGATVNWDFQGGSLRVTGGGFHNNGTQGLLVSGGGGGTMVTVTGTEFVANTGNQFEVSGSEVSLRDSNATAGKSHGVRATDSNLVVDKCIVTGNTLDGIYCSSTPGARASGARVLGTVTELNGGHGIRVEGGSLLCRDGTCRSNGGGGIYIFGGGPGLCPDASVTVTECRIEDNLSIGLEVRSSSGGTVEKCVVGRNGGDGIIVGDQVPGVCCKGMYVSDCRVTLNSGVGLRVLDGGGHVVVRNSCGLNTGGDFVVGAGGNTVAPIVTAQALPQSSNALVNIQH